MKRLLTKNDGVWRETGKKPVVYGLGRALSRLALEMSDVVFFIDSFPNKVEQNPCYDGKLFGPEKLKDVSPADYFIVVSSRKHANDIIATIKKIVNIAAFEIHIGCDEISYFYDDVDELLKKDPLVIRQVSRFCSGYFDFEQIKRFFFEAYNSFSCNNDCYLIGAMSQGGGRLTLRVLYNSNEYVYSCPGGDNKSSLRTQEFYDFSKDTLLNDGLTLWHNSSGYSLQRYALPLERSDLNDAVLYLARLHRHSQVIKTKTQIDIIDRYSFWKKELVEKSLLNESREAFLKRCDALCKYIELKAPKPTICHGDANLCNCFKLEKKMCFIDWDAFGMGNPYFDVAVFLVSYYERFYKEVELEKVFSNLNFVLQVYDEVRGEGLSLEYLERCIVLYRAVLELGKMCRGTPSEARLRDLNRFIAKNYCGANS